MRSLVSLQERHSVISLRGSWQTRCWTLKPDKITIKAPYYRMTALSLLFTVSMWEISVSLRRAEINQTVVMSEI